MIHGGGRRACAVVWAIAVAAITAGTAGAQQAETAGINIRFALSSLKSGQPPAAGHDAGFAVTLTTGKTGTPLRGAKPAAWLVGRASDEKLDERQCRATAAAFVRGASLMVPALDLNTYYVLSLNNDASIAVIDPRIGFGGSHLIGMATFDAPASDWALTPDQRILAVAVPAADRVALVDTENWSIRENIAVPNAARLALASNGRVLLASYRAAAAIAAAGSTAAAAGQGGEGGIAVIDLAAPGAEPPRIATGAGPHDIAIDGEGRFAFVSNGGADTVSVIDLATRRVVGSVATGRQPVAVVYSQLARRAYVAARDGIITAITASPVAASGTVAAPPGLAALRFAPGDRFALAASPQAGQVVVLDAATDRIVQRLDVAGQPDALAFSDHFAFLRHRANEFFDAVPLEQIGTDGATPITVGAGRLALGAVSVPARADAMAPVPDGDALMIANAGDRAIYYYREGMGAASGSLSTYGREPRAVRIVDRRLREVEPGVYRTIGRLPRAGAYEVVLYVDSPRLVHCFEVRVDGDPAGQATAATPRVADLVLTGTPRAGEGIALQFRLIDPDTGMPVSGVRDARVLSFLIPGSNAARSAARPLGNGAYAAEIRVLQPGNYYVFVEAPSVALASAAGRVVAVAPAAAP